MTTAVASWLLTPFPAPLTPFIGREREKAAIGALMDDPDVRLITLTGPGGSGKTRVALEVVRQGSARFPDGSAFVDLAPLSDPGFVVAEIARVLRIADAGGRPVRELLWTALGARRLVLLLDNYEHVLASAPEVSALLEACPGVMVLVTSRAPLEVRGEREYPLAPMPVPGAAPLTELGRNDAVRLFVQQARAIDPDFRLDAGNATTITAICARLDGLPLAIELAAARLRALSLEALLARLDRRLPLLAGGPRDAPARQRALRTTIGWSYDLLGAGQQALFRRLGVFVGDFPLSAVEQVAEPLDPDMLAGVEALVAHNLLRRTVGGPTSRYQMLETIREFAIEQLGRLEELTAARRSHAEWCTLFADRVMPGSSLGELPDQRVADVLASEYDNLRVGLAWLIERGDAERAARLATILANLWFVRGYLTEGIDWLERIFALQGELSRATAAGLHFWLGALSVFRGDRERAPDDLAASAALYVALDDTRGRAACYTLMAARADYAGDAERSIPLHERALAEFRIADDANGIAQALANLSDLAYQQGDAERALRHSREALTWLNAFDNAWTKAFVLSNHAHLLLERGERTDAAPLLEEALSHAERTKSPLAVIDVLVGFASLFGARGDWKRAAALLGAIDSGSLRHGIWTVLHHAQLRRVRDVAQAELSGPAFARAYADGQGLTPESAVAEARAAANLAADRRPATREAPGGLTARELEVVRLIAAGHTDRDIAAALFVSTRTVTTHVTHILTKLDVASRTEAAAWAVRHGVA